MTTSNKILMKEAVKSLSGKWGIAVVGYLIYSLITGVAGGIKNFGPLISLVLTGPMILGMSTFSLSISRGRKPKLEELFSGFDRFTVSLVAVLLITLWVVLWSLLLVVPGIIKAISYSQVFYLLADNKSLGAKEALEKSAKLMSGFKWKYFCLHLRFFGWFLLSILTCGIGFIWLIPYVQVSTAKFYEDLIK